MKTEPKFASGQQGAILVVSLILLLIMTVLAVTISQTSRMQERMTGNARDADLAFQAAEAGLRSAEAFIFTQTTQPAACGSGTCAVYQKNILPSNLQIQDPTTFWNVRGTEYGVVGTKDIANVRQDPRYVIEEAGFVPDSLTKGKGVPTGRTYYRDTSEGTGGTSAAQAVVQGTFTRRF